MRVSSLLDSGNGGEQSNYAVGPPPSLPIPSVQYVSPSFPPWVGRPLSRGQLPIGGSDRPRQVPRGHRPPSQCHHAKCTACTVRIGEGRRRRRRSPLKKCSLWYLFFLSRPRGKVIGWTVDGKGGGEGRRGEEVAAAPMPCSLSLLLGGKARRRRKKRKGSYLLPPLPLFLPPTS